MKQEGVVSAVLKSHEELYHEQEYAIKTNIGVVNDFLNRVI